MGNRPNRSKSVYMVNNPMILLAKWFRSESSSAASLPPGQIGGFSGTDCDFLPARNCETVSDGSGLGLLPGDGKVLRVFLNEGE